MPGNFGRVNLQTTGYPERVSADGCPNWKIGGITLDPTVLPSNGTGSPLILIDQTSINNSELYLLLGTVMCRITSGEVDVVTLNNTPTGGTFTVSAATPAEVFTATLGSTSAGTFTLSVSAGGNTQAATIAYNASSSTFQSAVAALTNVGSGNVTASGSSGGPYTFSFAPSLGTITVSINGNGLTGGSATISNAQGTNTQTTAGIAFNATAATLQAAIVGLPNVGAGNATVSGSAGGPFTITYASSIGTVTTTANGASLTGAGAQPTATVTSNLAGGQTGAFGPYLSSATDGRQSLNRGDCYILDSTWRDTPNLAFPNQGTAHPPVFDGGRIDIKKMVLSTGQGSNALPAGYPAGPTLSAFLAAFPAVTVVND